MRDLRVEGPRRGWNHLVDKGRGRRRLHHRRLRRAQLRQPARPREPDGQSASRSRLQNLNDDADTDDPGETVAAVTGGDNRYQITVSATEVWNNSDESLPAKRSDIDLTVTVGNVDDAGELTLEWLQAEVGIVIERHPDRPRRHRKHIRRQSPARLLPTDLGYTWYRSKVADPE